MNSMISPATFAGPAAAWSKLAWNAGEMLVASLQVISHRSGRFMVPGAMAKPSASDNRELAMMSEEKGKSVLESAQAVGVQMLAFNQQLATLAFKQIFSTSMAMMRIASSRTEKESSDRQVKLVLDTMSNTVDAAAKLSDSSARVAKVAMKPVHKRVKANVRRLSKRK